MVSVLTDRGIGSTVARENDGSVQPRLGLIQLCRAKTSPKLFKEFRIFLDRLQSERVKMHVAKS